MSDDGDDDWEALEDSGAFEVSGESASTNERERTHNHARVDTVPHTHTHLLRCTEACSAARTLVCLPHATAYTATATTNSFSFATTATPAAAAAAAVHIMLATHETDVAVCRIHVHPAA